jgi:uncharacterized protein YuzE
MVTYDSDADVLYVRLSDAAVSATKTLDDLRLIDVASDGVVIGIEFIAASGGVDLCDVPFRPRVEKLIGDSGYGIKILA